MGHNLALNNMMGMPTEVACPKCEAITITWAHDFDVTCGNCNPAPGVWRTYAYCNDCEHEWFIYWKVTTTEIQKEEFDGILQQNA